ncbi:MAG TPA: phage portal protein [Nocardioidaceae bacterium]|nr:phage portal protein [Nocardioidaceae bacterium]
MGLWPRVKAWFAAPDPGPRVVHFSTLQYPVDQLGFLKILRGQRIDRKAALGVPAVLRTRNQLCSIGSLPLELVDASNRVQDHPLFAQIDPNVPNIVTLAMTIEDLLFDAVAWWRVIEVTDGGYPAKAQRYAPSTVTLEPPSDYQRGYLPSDLPTEGVVYMEGRPVPFGQVIRFDSPNPGLLDVGERAIRRAIALDEAADLYAVNRRMRGFFTPADPTVDPADDTDIEDMLTDFASAREKRLDGYVPAALKYNPIQDPTPAELQVIQQQQRVDLQIANAGGLDPEDLGVSTTSRTYQNAVDRRKDRVNDVLSPYMKAITDRLSMPDVTRPGYRARFQLDDYLKADPKTRAEVQQAYADMGVTDPAEIRESEGLPPRAIAPPLRAAVPPSQVSAIPGGAR